MLLEVDMAAGVAVVVGGIAAGIGTATGERCNVAERQMANLVGRPGSPWLAEVEAEAVVAGKADG